MIIIGLAITACIGLNNLLVLGNVAAYSGTYEETTAALYKESFVIQVIGLGLVVPVAERFISEELFINGCRLLQEEEKR